MTIECNFSTNTGYEVRESYVIDKTSFEGESQYTILKASYSTGAGKIVCTSSKASYNT